ncbi:MAG TPA: prolyl oligopeptidase family serine peptidase [Tepidimicrobium sp.]|nr:prolyl oligopeptidase family serine peptidase [Tepidimicrobium sp.]
MKNWLRSDHVIEEKIYINKIPAILFRPVKGQGLYPTIIFYHGWSSNKENQRFRAFILATLGYQVIIPDAINHGERGPIDYESTENMERYFWDTIFSNIDESKEIIEGLACKWGADSNRIGVVGNSMGGFTAAGVFTHNSNIRVLVVFNGSCGWEYSNEYFKKTFKIKVDRGLKSIEDKVKKLDPMNNLDILKNRPILMLHGDNDNMVSIESQRLFYEKIKPLYRDKNKIQLIEYSNLDHFVTTNMMEECINWFYSHL